MSIPNRTWTTKALLENNADPIELDEQKQRETLLKLFSALDPGRRQIIVNVAVSPSKDLARAERLRLPPSKLYTPAPRPRVARRKKQ